MLGIDQKFNSATWLNGYINFDNEALVLILKGTKVSCLSDKVMQQKYIDQYNQNSYSMMGSAAYNKTGISNFQPPFQRRALIDTEALS